MRTDIHRPSAINVADYQFVAYDYLGENADFNVVIANRNIIREHKTRTGAKYSTHAHGGSCHICGAHALYTALFHHVPSNTYICTGLDCAEKLDHGVNENFRKQVQKGLAAKAGIRKAEAYLASKNLTAAWEIYNATDAKRDNEEMTLSSMVSNLVKYGSLSDKQVNFMTVLLDRIVRRDEIKAQREVERNAAKPVPVTDKRMKIVGQVVSIKTNEYIGHVQMLVKTTDGYMLFGTLPSAFDRDVRGQNVSFVAKVKPSDKDPKFGFFSRPAQAVVLAA